MPRLGASFSVWIILRLIKRSAHVRTAQQLFRGAFAKHTMRTCFLGELNHYLAIYGVIHSPMALLASTNILTIKCQYLDISQMQDKVICWVLDSTASHAHNLQGRLRYLSTVIDFFWHGRSRINLAENSLYLRIRQGKLPMIHEHTIWIGSKSHSLLCSCTEEQLQHQQPCEHDLCLRSLSETWGLLVWRDMISEQQTSEERKVW